MPVSIPLKNMVDGDGTPESVNIGLGIIVDYGPILEGATRYAIERKGEPKDGCELYDYGKALYTVATTAVDPDSDPKNPVPFFGKSDNPTLEERVEDARTHPNIGRDTILFLAECQDVWQDECSPQPGIGEKTPEEYYTMIAGVAAQGPLAFLQLSAGTRLKFLLFTANLLLTLPTLNTTSGSTSGE
jgi:hypothetical protein